MFSRYSTMLFSTILILIAACSTARVIKREDVARIEVGRSTKKDVVSALGLPNHKTVDGENERWLYFKEPSQTTTSMATMGSFKQAYKTGIPVPVMETTTQSIHPNVAAILWLDNSGTVVEVIQGDLK